MILKHLLTRCADFFLPPACPGCRSPGVSAHGSLCPTCWSELHFISAPFCQRCATPLEVSGEATVTCAACLDAPPVYHQARAVLSYNALCKRLVLRLKDGGETHLAPLFATWMLKHGHDILKHADLIVPVPLHWARLVSRGFNQSVLLGRRLSKLSGVPIDFDCVKKVRNTPSQGTLNAKERQKNVQDSFELVASGERHIAGQHIVLIDDVLSSGATVTAIAQLLLKKGAKQVDVITLARAHLHKA